MSERYLRVAEVAERLGIGRSHAYALIHSAALPHIRLGSALRIPERALEEYLATRTVFPETRRQAD